MMRCDAEWLAQMLVWQKADALSPILNLGSSTRHWLRRWRQPKSKLYWLFRPEGMDLRP
jgi:hypothetical protein